MILPPLITTPMRVTSVNQEYRGEEQFPVWVYALHVDHIQSQRMVRDWDKSQPSEYIVFDEFKFCTETQLPIGVGDLFTPDLVPTDGVPESDKERNLRERWEALIETLRGASPFLILPHDEEDR